MGFVLDSIVKKDILIGPETISSDFTSDVCDISGLESDFAVQLDYDGGASVNMTLQFQVSVDGTSYVTVDSSSQVITDATGTHIWDLAGTGATFARVFISVAAGSIDIQSIQLNGKRRH